MMRKLKNIELNRISVEEFQTIIKNPIIVVLDNVRSMNNIGSVFRTCDAFLVESVYLCGFTATPPHKDIHKTALGATESVYWKYYTNTESAVSELKQNNYIILSVEQTEESIALNEFQPIAGHKYALVFGNEVKGVEQNVVDMCDACIEIPQYGTKHSLNISVSAGIVLWDICHKIKAAQKSI
jgi:23S rRNA (guanosine2251-2'-O)-methyltransferase